MLRKQILRDWPGVPVSEPGEKDIAACATVLVTSEDPEYPIDQAFDRSRGPYGSRWIASASGEQTLLLAFDTPQTIRAIRLEVEERDVPRTQELAVSISRDGGRTYQELRRQEYTFSPSGATFEREEWAIAAEGVTHLCLVIRPDKGGGPARATLTTLALW